MGGVGVRWRSCVVEVKRMSERVITVGLAFEEDVPRWNFGYALQS